MKAIYDGQTRVAEFDDGQFTNFNLASRGGPLLLYWIGHGVPGVTGGPSAKNPNLIVERPTLVPTTDPTFGLALWDAIDGHGWQVRDEQPRPNLRVNELIRQINGNAFCKTGIGGGVNPTCSPGRKGKSEAGRTGSKVAFPEANPETGEMDLEHIKDLGGLTGAMLVKASDGKQYVYKTGGNAEHVKAEYQANRAYAAAGMKVADAELYETEDGAFLLTRYMPKLTYYRDLSKQDQEKAKAKIQEGWALDAVLANWDVMGHDTSNMFVDQKGNPVRLDQGGCLDRRGSGQSKTYHWNEKCDELETLGDSSVNWYTGPIYGDMTPEQKIASIDAMLKKRKQILKAVGPDYEEMVSKRMDAAKDHRDALKKGPKAGTESPAGVIKIIDPDQYLPGPAVSDADIEMWTKSLSQAEKKAVSEWKGSPKEIRMSVESKKPSKTAVAMLTALQKAPVYKGTLYRGVHNDPPDNMYADKLVKTIEDLGVGSLWSDPAPAGGSRNIGTAIHFSWGNVVLIVRKIKNARSIEGEAGFDHEAENCIMPGTFFIRGIHKGVDIKGASKHPKKAHNLDAVIELEEI